jgi:hypothetical protein
MSVDLVKMLISFMTEMFFPQLPWIFCPKWCPTLDRSIQPVFWKAEGFQPLSAKNISLSFLSFPLMCKISPLLHFRPLGSNPQLFRLQNMPLHSDINFQIFWHQNLLFQSVLVTICSIFIFHLCLQSKSMECLGNNVSAFAQELLCFTRGQ